MEQDLEGKSGRTVNIILMCGIPAKYFSKKSIFWKQIEDIRCCTFMS